MALKYVAPVAGGSTGDGSELTPYLYWPTLQAGNEYRQINDYETTGLSRTINLVAANVVVDGLRSGGSTQADFWGDGAAGGVVLKNARLRQGLGSYSVALFGASTSNRVASPSLQNILFLQNGAAAAYAMYLRLCSGLLVDGVEIHGWVSAGGGKQIYVYDAPGVLKNINASGGNDNGIWTEANSSIIIEDIDYSNYANAVFCVVSKTNTYFAIKRADIDSYRALSILQTPEFLVSDCVINGAFATEIIGSTGTIENTTITGTGNGVSPTTGSVVTCRRVTVSVDNDGFSTPTEASALGTKYISIGCSATQCGDESIVASGDGYTVHAKCSADILFSFAAENLKSGLAVTGDSAGTAYNNTFIDNLGGSADAGLQAGMWFNATGAWTAKNNLVVQRGGYCCTITGGATCPTLDYNAYLSDALDAFSVDGNDKTFAQYIASGAAKGGNAAFESHSIFIHEHEGQWDVYRASAPSTVWRTLSYCPVTVEGRLVGGVDNPLIKAAVGVSGVTDQAHVDAWSNVTGVYPNIGADQYDYAPGYGPWSPFDSSMPTLALAPTAPGKLKEVQEWKKVASAKEIERY